LHTLANLHPIPQFPLWHNEDANTCERVAKNPETKFIYDAKLDPVMQNAYFDADEMRERVLPDGRVLPYRYVHGVIQEKAIKFIFCFPPKENYQGRFFQYLSPFPGPDEEPASLDKTGEDDKIAFCLLHSAYYVESNMGSAYMFGEKSDSTLCFKASAAAAEWSRKVAMEYYGCGRPYGYVHGGKGSRLAIGMCFGLSDLADVIDSIKPGDHLTLDN